ncbi:MAG TPA: hypothetical protein VMZ71_12945 [Gemmataceae bacterium]|nr:hypothetical protein [Gemmataceae bacterium]
MTCRVAGVSSVSSYRAAVRNFWSWSADSRHPRPPAYGVWSPVLSPISPLSGKL